MNLIHFTKSLSALRTPILAVFMYEDKGRAPKVGRVLEESLRNLRASKDFTGKFGEKKLLFLSGPIPRALLVGLGKKADVNLEKFRAAVAGAVNEMKKMPVSEAAFLLPTLPKVAERETARAWSETVLLAGYQFKHYKKRDPEESVLENILLVGGSAAIKAGVREGGILGRAACMVRDLGNHPGNVATPGHLAAHAKRLARDYPAIKVHVLDRKEIEKEKMGALLAVAKGSDEEPRFIIMDYLPRRSSTPRLRLEEQAGRARTSAPTIVLVGKGITFDSGGISIKPSDKMEEMKFDMAGAATVMGVITAAAELQLPLNLVGLIPATENLPSGKASKPGDIVRSRSGKTIEIVNTDAEGRLVLADGLDYAKKYQPDLVIDFATLTGAIVVALGDDLIGAFSNRESLLPKLQAAGKISGEPIWPMPLYQEYEQFIKSNFADLKNVGLSKFGDAVNAALFLQNFIDYPWIHLDIAGVAWTTREKPYRALGATGTGVRLAIEFLKNFRK